MKYEISNSDKEAAIQYLIESIDDERLQEFWDKAQNQDDMWRIKLHYGFGIFVRNSLREGGFNWDDIILDGYWYDLIFEAARRFVNKNDSLNKK